MNPATTRIASETDSPLPGCAVPRFCQPDRTRLDPHPRSLDELIAAEHSVRAVWDLVLQMDLTPLHARYRAVEHHPGRPPIDVRLLVALWLYATLEGIASAHELARRCTRDDPFKWLCGGVSVNYHTLADFRTAHLDWLAEQLTWSVAVLRSQGLVDLNRVAQDGLRVRASAGAGSFRGETKLAEAYQEAQQHWQALQAELQENPARLGARRQRARVRAARQRLERLERAHHAWRQIEGQREKRKKGDGPKARASTTDPEARRMKMPDGGYRPAYNVQFATALDPLVVVGVDVTNAGTDAGQLAPMVEQIQHCYGVTPQEWYVDGSFATKEDITQVSAQGITVYAPIKEEAHKRQHGRDPYAPAKGDTPAVAAWRQRMGTAEAKAKYRARSLCEWTNATTREHGLTRLLVRGLAKVKAVALWHALATNVRRWLALAPLPAAGKALARALAAPGRALAGTVRPRAVGPC
jgi:transposase